MARLQLRKGQERANSMRLAGTRDDELKRYRGELGGEGMRDLRDLAMILVRAGQVYRPMQSKDELREQGQRRHSDGDAAPLNSQPRRHPAHTRRF